ncbi:hypothetical protein DEO72_LG6g653 [Vigna unguiculata]|uniref:Uncharacterized protein n=1 Tax=Vigna unguiculata TaxID=3917 RepID=A0A4D6M460_VIGUN|nr:hypothetical protein DEO72_LG6g653 [Vigna unguiculata]
MTARIAHISLQRAGIYGCEGKWGCLVVTRGRSHPYIVLGKKEEKDVSPPIKLFTVVDVVARAPRRPKWVPGR